jgi:hypothetical protein
MSLGPRFSRPLRCLLACSLLMAFPSAALASHASTGSTAGNELLFRVQGGVDLATSSYAYDRAEVAPLVAAIDALPHGSELAKLQLNIATPAEVRRRCGEETMSCYDPREDEMVIDGENEEMDGVSRASLIAHEYGHHIANNRQGGGIWSAFEVGTPRWSTYEEVCERTREGTLFPGNEGAHYWENPGEAFAQTYATLVVPETAWPYSPLLRPDETALRKVREDVLNPVATRELRWRVGSPPRPGPSIGDALPVERGSFVRFMKAPVDGRIAVRLQAEEDGRYRLSLLDASTGELLSRALPGSEGKTSLHYADCGHRLLQVRAEAIGGARGFTAEALIP